MLDQVELHVVNSATLGNKVSVELLPDPDVGLGCPEPLGALGEPLAAGLEEVDLGVHVAADALEDAGHRQPEGGAAPVLVGGVVVGRVELVGDDRLDVGRGDAVDEVLDARVDVDGALLLGDLLRAPDGERLEDWGLVLAELLAELLALVEGAAGPDGRARLGVVPLAKREV